MKKLNFVLVALFLMVVPAFVACQSRNGQSQDHTLSVNAPVEQKDGWTIFTNTEQVNDLIADGDVLWAATSGGVVRWQPTSGTVAKYTTLDGLASNHVFCLAQDKEGSLWFGTDLGLSRYDGRSWRTYTTEDGLASDKIVAIAADKEGIWVAGATDIRPGTDVAVSPGVSRNDGTNWRTFEARDGLISNAVSTIFVDRQGDAWFGTDAGVSRYDGVTWQSFTPDDGLATYFVSGIGQDKRGNMWFATWSAGISRYDGKDWTTFLRDDGPGSNAIKDIAQDGRGDLWFATEANGVTRYDGRSWRNFTTRDGLPGNYIDHVVKDSRGNIWCDTSGPVEGENTVRPTGVGYYDGRVWRSYTRTDELPGNDISALAVDQAGDVWSGISGKGVVRYDGVNWRLFTTKDGLYSNNVRAIVVDKSGSLWFDFGGTFSRYDGTAWSSPTGSGGSASVGTISTDLDGNIWVVNQVGVTWYDGVDWHALAGVGDLPDKDFKLVSKDAKGNVWLAGTRLWQFDGANWRASPGGQLPGQEVTAMSGDDDGNLWVGTRGYESYALQGYGVSRYDGSNWMIFELGGATVRSIFQDDQGNMWFCTNVGLVRYDGATWDTLTVEDGLASNKTQAVAEQNGVLWIGTEAGISRCEAFQQRTGTVK